MPIIATIGRRKLRVRLLIGSIYLLLLAGALTMVYPFLLMLAGCTKSNVDMAEFSIVPAFLYDDSVLYRKYTEGLFNEGIPRLRVAYVGDDLTFVNLQPPAQINRAMIGEWEQFLATAALPDYCSTLGWTQTPFSRTLPWKLREFKAALVESSGRDLQQVKRKLGQEFSSWSAVVYPTDVLFMERGRNPVDSPFQRFVGEFKARQPKTMSFYGTAEGSFRESFLRPQYNTIQEYNRAHGTNYASFSSVRLTSRATNEAPLAHQDWERFVRRNLNSLWLRADAQAAAPYQEYLQAKYATLAALNARYHSSYSDWADIRLVQDPVGGGAVVADWEMFIQGWKDPLTNQTHAMPLEMIRLVSVDMLFRDYLREKYHDTDALNAALGSAYADFADIVLPQQEWHYLAFQERRGTIRWEFIARNFLAVFDYVILHGRGLANTLIYCALSVLCALTFNPLAAYAMSRAQLPSNYKILLLLMLTVAFPPMLTQIPVFLMLRKLGLLNTFAALVLPGLANGYSIFLLKGFFDSIPRELYESAELDGAGQWTVFWNITMSLSRPILAVIALGAFTAAYANFMFALLICQDERMWTLMVWLYQLQIRSGPGVVYASLIIAAVPMLLMFMFCQNIIMRGIVVPVEK